MCNPGLQRNHKLENGVGGNSGAHLGFENNSISEHPEPVSNDTVEKENGHFTQTKKCHPFL